MPLPKPKKGEKEKDFIARCMGDGTMRSEYKKQSQRGAICYSQWRSVHGKAELEAEFMASVDPVVACQACQSRFRPEHEPEVAMGAVACPTCGAHVNQEGGVVGNKVTLQKAASGADNSSSEVSFQMSMQIDNIALRDVGIEASATEVDPFAKLGYEPDMSKAYVDFDVVHCMPAVIGPVQEGFWTTHLPNIVAASHGTLLHQQLNLNHLLKQYGDDEEKVAKDRIVGCVVATYFPPTPAGGWKIGSDAAAAPCIRAKAVIFKLADGVNRIIGDHQASRKKQSVSMETTATLGNLGIYLPSRGPDNLIPFDKWGDEKEIRDVLSLSPLKIGQVNGEQAVFVYGMKDPIHFKGVALTPRPAEREAKIISFKAEKTTAADGGTIISMAAQMVEQELLDREVTFRGTGKKGRIDHVWNEGEGQLPGMSWSIKASRENPVVRVKLGDGRHVLHPLSALAGQLS